MGKKTQFANVLHSLFLNTEFYMNLMFFVRCHSRTGKNREFSDLERQKSKLIAILDRICKGERMMKYCDVDRIFKIKIKGDCVSMQ